MKVCQVQALLESIIRNSGIIRGRALHEEIQDIKFWLQPQFQKLSSVNMKYRKLNTLKTGQKFTKTDTV